MYEDIENGYWIKYENVLSNDAYEDIENGYGIKYEIVLRSTYTNGAGWNHI